MTSPKRPGAYNETAFATIVEEGDSYTPQLVSVNGQDVYAAGQLKLHIDGVRYAQVIDGVGSNAPVTSITLAHSVSGSRITFTVNVHSSFTRLIDTVAVKIGTWQAAIDQIGNLESVGNPKARMGGPAYITIRQGLSVAWLATKSESIDLKVYSDLLLVYFYDLPPNQTTRAVVTVDFVEGSIDSYGVIADVCEDYRQRYPQLTHWADRRPVGLAVPSQYANVSQTNPNGWIPMICPVGTDARTISGQQTIRNNFLLFADECVSRCLAAGAQGCIFWGIDGQQPLGVGYVGAPADIDGLQLLTGIDVEFVRSLFDRFFGVGLRVGVLIRPQRLMPSDTAFGYQQWLPDYPSREYAQHVYDELHRQISFCVSRLGCSIFYIDSSVNPADMKLIDVYRQLQITHRDVLLVPEITREVHAASAAPYTNPETPSTSRLRRYLWPYSFSFVNKPQAGDDAIQGNLISFNSWYGTHWQIAKTLHDAVPHSFEKS